MDEGLLLCLSPHVPGCTQEGVSKKQFCCWMMTCGPLRWCATPAASAMARTCFTSVLCLLAVLQHTAGVLQAREHCTPHACNLRGTTLVVDQAPS